MPVSARMELLLEDIRSISNSDCIELHTCPREGIIYNVKQQGQHKITLVSSSLDGEALRELIPDMYSAS